MPSDARNPASAVPSPPQGLAADDGSAAPSSATLDVSPLVPPPPTPVAAPRQDSSPCDVTFLCGLTHQLRNAVFGMTATIDLLEITVPPTPPFANAAATMRQHTGRLLRVLAELDAYAEAGLEPHTTLPLAPLVREACAAAGRLAEERGVAIVQTGAATPVAIRVEPASLAHALRSLIETAVLRTSARGTVTVTQEANAADRVELRIEDEGPHLKPETLARALEPFAVRGPDLTGLSFALAARVAAAHGGQIAVQNRPSGGLTVRCRLPVSEPPAD